jgi:HD superfamily phosphohydrolase
MKIIHCSIWGDIEVDDLAHSLLDTWTFQRLHYIRQTGFGYKVFPTAQVSRFAHSLGCYHITRRLLQEIQRRQPEVIALIPPRVLQLIPIAGLCHDIGHAAYSHWFDRLIGELVEKKGETHPPTLSKNSWYHHEERGVDILRTTITEMTGGKFEENREFQNLQNLQNLQNCQNCQHCQHCQHWQHWRKGDIQILEKLLLGPHEHWYEHIVTNPKSCLDTDKIDYIVRDVRQFGLEKSMGSIDVSRLFANCRVQDNELQFCERIRDDIEHIFYLRSRLYTHIYQHPTIRRFEDEMMVCIRNNPSLVKELVDIIQNRDYSQFLLLTDEPILQKIFPCPIQRQQFECRQWTLPKTKSFDGQDRHRIQREKALQNIKYYPR